MIPSLLQIPSAVSDSKLHSVLPNNGKGDFTFDRSTGATRINKDGLIEEVGYFSSELVQNGNFSELGSELVTNGDFATDSDWTLATGWTINDNKLRADNVSLLNVTQAYVYTSGKTYKVTYTISDYVKGAMRFQLGGGGGQVNGAKKTANGTYTEYLTANANHTSARVRALSDDGGFTGSVDNVSVKQVDPNDRWVLASAWDISDKASYDATGNGSSISQSNVFQNNGSYKIAFTISDVASGQNARIFMSNADLSEVYLPLTSLGNGNYVYVVNATATNDLVVRGYLTGSGVAFSIDNISVVEVQGDRPRLSYDITNGVVEDKPHLLLEPSSTNLVTFSEDFSQWTVDGEASISSDSIISPEGIQNSDKLIAGTTSGRQAIKLSSTSSGNLSFSIFAKKGEYSVIQLSDAKDGSAFANFNLDTGAVGSTGVYTASIVNMGNDWYRCKISWNASLSIVAIRVGIVTTASSARVEQFAGNGSDGLYIYGAQLEQQTYCTSYIKTAGTTITRAAETCNNSKPSVNSTEGVLFVDYASLSNSGNYRLICLSDGTTSNRVFIGLRLDTGYVYYFVIVGGSTVASHITSTTSLDFSKVAVKWKANDFALWINGSEISTDTSGSSFSANTLNTLQMNEGDGAGFEFYGKVKGLAVYNEALSESQLMQLTGVTASSIYNNFVTRTASFTVEALNEVKKVIDNL